MSGFKSKYNGNEIENILDKVDSIEVGVSEAENTEPFDSITIGGVVYKIRQGNQLGLYQHKIKFTINSELGGDNRGDTIIDDRDNTITFYLYNTSSTPFNINNVFDGNITLSFGKIVYNNLTSPKTINNPIMISAVGSYNIKTITFVYTTDNTSTLNGTKSFYVLDFSDTVSEVISGEVVYGS